MAIISRHRWLVPLLISAIAIVVAALWLAIPGSYPYGPDDPVRVGVNHLIPHPAGAAMLMVSGVLGLALATLMAVGKTGRVLAAGCAVQAAFFAFVMSDASIISSLGYAAALAGPPALVAVVVLACRKWPSYGLVPAGAVLVAFVIGMATGRLDHFAGAVAAYLGGLAQGWGFFGVRIAWAWGMALASAGWLLAAGTAARRPRPSVMNTGWARAVTIVAALGPVPYGVARLSWLTPWPLGGVDAATGEIQVVIPHSGDLATRLQGSLFGLACAVGVVLQLGLISRWGEVFPRWVPGLGGRTVPIMLAVIPGGLMAAVITISASGTLTTAMETGSIRETALHLLFFPFPIWGPALAAAVYAYRQRRLGISVG